MEALTSTCCEIDYRTTGYISGIYTVVISIYYMAMNIGMLVGGPYSIYWYPQQYIVIVFNLVNSLILLAMSVPFFVGISKSNANLVLTWLIYCWIYIVYTFITLPIGFIIVAILNPDLKIIYPAVVWVAVSVSVFLQFTLIFCTRYVHIYYRQLKTCNLNRQIFWAPVGPAYGSNYIDPSGKQIIVQPYNLGLPPGGQAYGPYFNQPIGSQIIQPPYYQGFQPGVQAYGPNYNNQTGNQMTQKPYHQEPPSTNQAYETNRDDPAYNHPTNESAKF